VIASAGVAIALGTYFGGWRIIRTVGHRLTAIEGFAVLCFAICAAAVAYSLHAALTHPDRRRRFTRCTPGIRRRSHFGGALLSSDNQWAGRRWGSA
jgi:hypothetical protein